MIVQDHFPGDCPSAMSRSTMRNTLTGIRNGLLPGVLDRIVFADPPPTCKDSFPASLSSDFHIACLHCRGDGGFAAGHLLEHLLIQREGERVIVEPPLFACRQEIEKETEEKGFASPRWSSNQKALLSVFTLISQEGS